MRLDSLDKKELNKLYVRSCYLTQIGWLQFVALIIGVIACITAACLTPQGWDILLYAAVIAVPWFAVSYVFRYVRTPGARKFFYTWSIFGIVSGILGVIGCFVLKNYSSGIVLAVDLLISIEILKSAKTDALFGEDGFSHRQIAWARRKKRAGETFTDEELPESRRKPGLEKYCVIGAFVMIALFILTPIITAVVIPLANKQEKTSSEQKDYGSIESLRSQADAGNAGAQYEYAVRLMEGKGVAKDEKKGFEYLLKSAQNGNPHGQFLAAAAYMQGIGVEKNLQEAEKWALAAAEQKIPLAYACLSSFYLGGFDNPAPNDDKGFMWSKRAAEAGLATGKVNLALCYLNGIGCAENRPEAVKFLKSAAAQGEKQAAELLKKLGE